MTKRILSILIILALALAVLPAAAEESALQFGGDSLQKGWIVFLGKDDGHVSLAWQVLDVNEDRAMLITKNTVMIQDALDATEHTFVSYDRMGPYDEYGNLVQVDDWNKSNIKDLCSQLYKDWKSDDSYKQDAQAVIPYTVEETENYHAGRFDFEFLPSSLSGSPFFALSAKEAEQYFDSEADRACTDADGNPAWWWLRSPVLHNSPYIDRSYIIGAVDDAGWLNALDIVQNYTPPTAQFRPGCQLRQTDVLFITSAKAGKAVPGRETASMEPIRNGSDNEWELTLLAAGRQFRAEADPLTAAPGGTLIIPYTKAPIGNNEALSVIICSKEGTPLYYGSRWSDHVDGTAEFPVPGDIAPGEYVVKVFNEKRNNGTISDVASPVTDIPLTVR